MVFLVNLQDNIVLYWLRIQAASRHKVSLLKKGDHHSLFNLFFLPFSFVCLHVIYLFIDLQFPFQYNFNFHCLPHCFYMVLILCGINLYIVLILLVGDPIKFL